MFQADFHPTDFQTVTEVVVEGTGPQGGLEQVTVLTTGPAGGGEAAAAAMAVGELVPGTILTVPAEILSAEPGQQRTVVYQQQARR